MRTKINLIIWAISIVLILLGSFIMSKDFSGVFLIVIGVSIMPIFRKMKVRNLESKRVLLVVLLFITFILVYNVGFFKHIKENKKDKSVALKSDSISTTAQKTVDAIDLKQDNLKVNFIDVGQADSILVTYKNYSLIIDGGNNDDSQLVVDFIKSQGIQKLDYVIGTHPNEDHIGGLGQVVKNFDIGKVIMTKVQNNTRTYDDLINQISKKNLKIISPVPKTKYTMAECEFEILAPNNNKYYDLNDYSIVVKLKYGNTSFLLVGDAEKVSESEMLMKKYDLKADVLKVGHHGSSSSTTKQFLNAVAPKYSIISVGKKNEYGHPAQSTLKRLTDFGCKIYRTDELGNITAISDGKTITFDKK